MESITPELEKRGYQQYRGKQFLNISGGILRNVAVYPNKNDAYVWYGAFPLCQHDLWLGWSASGGRFPKRTGALTIRAREELQPGIESLMRGAIKSARILNRIGNVAQFRELLLDQKTQFKRVALAYCDALVGELAEAKKCAQSYLDDGRVTKKTAVGAEALIEAVEDGEVPDLLRQTTQDNIRRLRLRRFLPKE